MRKIRLVDLLRSNSKLILLSIVTSLAAVASQLFTPWIMKTLIDYGIPKKDTQIIAFSILGLVLIPIFSTGFSFLTKTIHIKIGGEITDSLRKQVFRKDNWILPQDNKSDEDRGFGWQDYSFLRGSGRSVC